MLVCIGCVKFHRILPVKKIRRTESQSDDRRITTDLHQDELCDSASCIILKNQIGIQFPMNKSVQSDMRGVLDDIPE